jgi:hypothetical protein
VLLQCYVGWMPHALPAKYSPPGFDFGPFGVEGMAMMADPFRPKLPG